MPTISFKNKIPSVILIFQVDPKNQSALIEAVIENSKKVMEKKSGFVSASIHKSFDGTSVVNYAQWENRKLYHEAINFLIPDELKFGEKIFEIAEPDWNTYELVFSAGTNPALISKDANLVTVINKFYVKPEDQKKLLELLDNLRVVVEKQPGFISANVHRSFEKTGGLVSYAQWNTKEDYQAVYTNSDAIPILDEIKKISKFSWNLYEVVFTSD